MIPSPRISGRARVALVTLATLVSTAVIAPRVASHGGGHQPPAPPPPAAPPAYGGPGDTPGAGTPGGGRPSGPSRPGAPGTPGPSAPGVPGGGGGPRPIGAPTTLGGGGGVDLGDWRVWWGLEQHAFLWLRDALASIDPESPGASFAIGQGQSALDPSPLRPDDQTLAEIVRPALVLRLERDRQPGVVTSAMTALAKLRDVPPAEGELDTAAILTAALADANQQISETAAISLGITGTRTSLPTLGALVRNSEAGRDACDRSKVPDRTRAFAAVGLGIFARRASSLDQRRYAVHQLIGALESEKGGTRDLSVACIVGLGLAKLPDIEDPEQLEGQPPGSSRQALVAYLIAALKNKKLSPLIRAHLPRSIARIAGAGDEALQETAARAIVRNLEAPRAKREQRLGSVQALAWLGTAGEAPMDVLVQRALLKALGDGGAEERGATLIALGRVAGRPRGTGDTAWSGAREISKRLLRELARGNSRDRSWAALALGVQGHTVLRLGLPISADTSAAIRSRLRETGDPFEVGAFALALGLRRDVQAVPLLLASLERSNDDNARGTIAIALGLIGERSAAGSLKALLDQAVYRPSLMRPLVTALGLLRDRSLVPDLLARMQSTKSSSLRAVYAWALAYVGDRRAVDPLVAMLGDESKQRLLRGNAALGLGWICEDTRLPWNAELAEGVNLLAAPASLWSATGGGVLNLR